MPKTPPPSSTTGQLTGFHEPQYTLSDVAPRDVEDAQLVTSLRCVDCDCPDHVDHRVYVDDEMFNEPLCSSCMDDRLEPSDDDDVDEDLDDEQPEDACPICGVGMAHGCLCDESDVDEDVDVCEVCSVDIDEGNASGLGGCCAQCFFALSSSAVVVSGRFP